MFSQNLFELTKEQKEAIVRNFMNGESFRVNPLLTLKMISASSVFGEASYYRDGKLGTRVKDARLKVYAPLAYYLIYAEEKTTTEIFEESIDAALDYDFTGTLEWAAECRTRYNMRLNPQIIMVRAALHPKRKSFTEAHPGRFDAIEQMVMQRADEPASQAAYYLYLHGGKEKMPSLLKRSLAKKLASLGRYQVAKYKNHELGMIDTVRIVHANSPVLDELMQTGTVKAEEGEKTWENLRSEGKGWKEIFYTADMGHMALLRNLRGVFKEVEDESFALKYCEKLKKGVPGGKQFPFRYYTASLAVRSSDCHHQELLLETLEECIDLAVAAMPQLRGRTMALSDNSGSAWGTIPSEYGSVRIAEIDNLSSVIAAARSDEGYVGKFGNRLRIFTVDQKTGILQKAMTVSSRADHDVGGATEGGIWEFFKEAILKKEHWDNIFIYSDMQAGHGGLYGTSDQSKEYGDLFGASTTVYGHYINVFDLVMVYRALVNPKVNVYSIQTAGYINVCVPENAYRTAILYGWTGKELEYAAILNRLWDEADGMA